MSPGTCSEWLGLMAMDAIGRTTPEESLALRRHLEECEECRHQSEELRIAAGALGQLDPLQVDRLELQLEERLAEPGPDVGPPVLTSPVVGSMVASPVVDPAIETGPDTVADIDRTPTAIPWWRRRYVLVAGAAAVAAAVVAVALLGGSPSKPVRTVALSGQPGVAASVSLTAQTWGTRATLVESGEAPGQVLTVSMRSSSGRWWVAGSYRTGTRPGPVQVQLSCAVDADRITEVWVTNQAGHTVLNGYAD